MFSPPRPIFHFQFLSSKYRLRSASATLRSALSACDIHSHVIITQHEELTMKFVANTFNNRILSILLSRCCSLGLNFFSHSELNCTINSRSVYVPACTERHCVYISLQGLTDVCLAFESVSMVWSSGEVLQKGRRALPCNKVQLAYQQNLHIIVCLWSAKHCCSEVSLDLWPLSPSPDHHMVLSTYSLLCFF